MNCGLVQVKLNLNLVVCPIILMKARMPNKTVAFFPILHYNDAYRTSDARFACARQSITQF